jgi:hypothetical protein
MVEGTSEETDDNGSHDEPVSSTYQAHDESMNPTKAHPFGTAVRLDRSPYLFAGPIGGATWGGRRCQGRTGIPFHLAIDDLLPDGRSGWSQVVVSLEVVIPFPLCCGCLRCRTRSHGTDFGCCTGSAV